MKSFRLSVISILFILVLPLQNKAQELNAKIIQNGDLKELEQLLKTDPSLINKRIGTYGWLPITYAVESRNFETIKLFLKYGADINMKTHTHWTALTRSVEINHPEFVNFFIDLGAEVPCNTERSNMLLHKALRGGHEKLSEIMIEEENDLSPTDRIGNTLMHSAAISGMVSLGELLLKKKFEVNAENNYQLSPLHLATKFRKRSFIKFLLDNGADVNAKSYLGRTALDFASDYGYKEILSLLKQYDGERSDFSYADIKGPYLGQEAPGMEPKLFGQELVSTFEEEHGIVVFSPDGNEVYWTVRDIRSTWSKIFYMKRMEGEWQKPELLMLTDKYNNINPFVTYDNKRLYYSTDRPENENLASVNITYRNRLEDGNWSDPITMDKPINSITGDEGAFITPDGTLYFGSSRPGGEGSIDLYVSYLKDGKYSDPINLGKNINTQNYEAYSYVAPDHSYIIFETGRKEGYGSSDLYISFKNEHGEWEKAFNMGDKINSPSRETFPMLSQDGKYLFFSSTKKGKLDSYWVDAKVIDELRDRR